MKFPQILTALITLCGLILHAHAAPDLSRRAALSVLQTPDSGYRFQTRHFTSADGQRHYRIYIGLPESPAPPQGWPVLYALDGNAVLSNLTPATFAKLRQTPLVLVMIGYDTDLRLDVVARAYDYTPPHPQGLPLYDAMHPERKNGGADEFRQLIEQRIRPALAEYTHTDPQRQSLWGHSYGGLFVLNNLFTHPHSYTRYIAADPALWYQNGLIQTHAAAFFRQPETRHPLQIYIHQSGKRLQTDTNKTQNRNALIRQNTLSGTVWVKQLNELNNINAQHEIFDGETHGSLLDASFLKALVLAAQP